MALFSAVIWDNDGVLVDSEQVFFRATREALASLGAELTPAIWAREYLGAGRRSRDIGLALGADAERMDSVLERRDEVYRERLPKEATVLPHVRDTLRKLHGRIPMALVTGSARRHLNLMHRETELLQYFDPVITQDEYEKPKPDPQGYRLALQRLNVAAEHCLAIEDSPRGLAAALAAGIPCVLIPTSLTALDVCAGSYQIHADVSALPGLILGEQ